MVGGFRGPTAGSGEFGTIRLFLSSTFEDMRGERDHLITVVYPELEERLALLDLTFFDVDLRWGIPPSQNADLEEPRNSWAECRQRIDGAYPLSSRSWATATDQCRAVKSSPPPKRRGATGHFPSAPTAKRLPQNSAPISVGAALSIFVARRRSQRIWMAKREQRSKRCGRSTSKSRWAFKPAMK